MFLVLILPFGMACGQDYLIGEGDLLRITVYDNPDLTTEVRVSGEGRIKVPMIDEVSVKGMTVVEIGNKLARLYADGYIKNPQVGVFILEYRSRKVTALGEFNKPGPVEMRGEATLMEVISNAGGLTATAGDTLILQRKSPNGGTDGKGEIKMIIDLIKLLESGDKSLDIAVLDGDSIYVPRAAFVYVSGQVRNPGAYKITKGLTVLRSIALAGDFTPFARRGKANIIRKDDKGEISIPARMDELVLPDDIIVVPESLF